MTSWTVDDLKAWDERIREKVEAFGLDCYDQEFEICDQNQMLGLMAYSGMPSHYPHWSFGKAYERTRTLYDHGVSGLPYEMVINANPAIAYLMRDNSLCLQVLTMAHVYGHNDFFKRNFTFSFLRAELVIAMFKSQAERVRDYVEDPSIGLERVEPILDAAHALAYNCRRNPAIRLTRRDEQVERALEAARPPHDPFASLHVRPEYEQPDLHRVPLEPEENILLFIRDNNPRLTSWERDLLTIAHNRAQYFLPQIETKAINEGWACYWHRAIMNALDLPQELYMEFLVRHNQVVRPIPGNINPYHLGLTIWDDIARKNGAETPGTEKDETLFAIREVDRDASFLRRFLTEDLMRKMDLFEYRSNGNEELVIDKVSDQENWEQVKHTLIAQTGMGSFPVIRIFDADHGGNRTLYLKHQFDGRELDLKYAEETMHHLHKLWGRTIRLETELNGKTTALTFDGDAFNKKAA